MVKSRAEMIKEECFDTQSIFSFQIRNFKAMIENIKEGNENPQIKINSDSTLFMTNMLQRRK